MLSDPAPAVKRGEIVVTALGGKAGHRRWPGRIAAGLMLIGGLALAGAAASLLGRPGPWVLLNVWLQQPGHRR